MDGGRGKAGGGERQKGGRGERHIVRSITSGRSRLTCIAGWIAIWSVAFSKAQTPEEAESGISKTLAVLVFPVWRPLPMRIPDVSVTQKKRAIPLSGSSED